MDARVRAIVSLFSDDKSDEIYGFGVFGTPRGFGISELPSDE